MANKFYTKVSAPALPFSPIEYTQQYQDQANNTLRLYFSQIDAFASQFSQVFLVAKLPSAVTVGAGSRAFVTNSSVSTFGTTVAGGGSTNVPVYSDGVVWRVG